MADPQPSLYPASYAPSPSLSVFDTQIEAPLLRGFGPEEEPKEQLLSRYRYSAPA